MVYEVVKLKANISVEFNFYVIQLLLSFINTLALPNLSDQRHRTAQYRTVTKLQINYATVFKKNLSLHCVVQSSSAFIVEIAFLFPDREYPLTITLPSRPHPFERRDPCVHRHSKLSSVFKRPFNFMIVPITFFNRCTTLQNGHKIKRTLDSLGRQCTQGSLR